MAASESFSDWIDDQAETVPALAPRRRVVTGAQVAVVVVVIAGIQLALPDSVTVGPFWAIPALEVLGLPAGLAVGQHPSPRVFRAFMNTYVILLVMASVLNATLQFWTLVEGAQESADALLAAGFGVLVINMLSFALAYWWFDGGGPYERLRIDNEDRDLLFPQQGFPSSTWQPTLPDYCFTAYTNIIAFSPTDTMPLTHRAKFLFTIQSTVSLVTVLVTLSRAINLLQ